MITSETALQSWVNATKLQMVLAYTLFLKFLGKTWEQPKYTVASKIPFVPTEKELDDLIAGSGKKSACFLQLLKETGARSGEIESLKWIDIDFETSTVRITPEKNSLPRIFKLSTKCIGMLNVLNREDEKVFGKRHRFNQANILEHTRKVLARKLGNPRLLNIHLHSFRHWFGTMLYHKTKDVLYVKEKLGHRNINSTLLYIQIADAVFQEQNDTYHCKTAKTLEEAIQLCEDGWEEWSEIQGVKIYRKRK